MSKYETETFFPDELKLKVLKLAILQGDTSSGGIERYYNIFMSLLCRGYESCEKTSENSENGVASYNGEKPGEETARICGL